MHRNAYKDIRGVSNIIDSILANEDQSLRISDSDIKSIMSYNAKKVTRNIQAIRDKISKTITICNDWLI